MRADKPIYFQKVTPGELNTSTGDYGEDTIVESMKYASVTDTGTDMLTLLYGKIKHNAKTVRLQKHYNGVFDYIRIDEKRYKVDFERKLMVKHIFVVSEVQ